MADSRLSVTSSRTQSPNRFRSSPCCSRGASVPSPKSGRLLNRPTANHPFSAARGRVSYYGWRADFRQKNSPTTSARAFASVMCRQTGTGRETGCRAVSQGIQDRVFLRQGRNITYGGLCRTCGSGAPTRAEDVRSLLSRSEMPPAQLSVPKSTVGGASRFDSSVSK